MGCCSSSNLPRDSPRTSGSQGQSAFKSYLAAKETKTETDNPTPLTPRSTEILKKTFAENPTVDDNNPAYKTSYVPRPSRQFGDQGSNRTLTQEFAEDTSSTKESNAKSQTGSNMRLNAKTGSKKNVKSDTTNDVKKTSATTKEEPKKTNRDKEKEKEKEKGKGKGQEKKDKKTEKEKKKKRRNFSWTQ